MNQLNLFQECIPAAHDDKHKGIQWKLFVDGASRNNPGPSGAGIYITKNDIPFFKKGYFLGTKTNNQAEYLALLLGILQCKKHHTGKDKLYVFSDSELMIKHIKGEYKIKNPELKKLFTFAFTLLEGMNYSFCHVLREFNQEADAMANHGIDKKGKVPEEFKALLLRHGIEV